MFGSPSCSPIADAAEHGIGLLWLKILVSFAAVAATLSVLLTTLIGVSRVSFAMARDGSIPRFLAKVHHKFHTPYLAIIVTGAATAILPFIGGLRQMANVTNFGSLFVYSIVNLSAVSLMKKSTSIKHSHIALSLVGFASCVMLMFFLEWQSWIIGTVWVIIALLYYMIARRWKIKQP